MQHATQEHKRHKHLTVPEELEIIRLYDDPSAVYNKTHTELALMFEVCTPPLLIVQRTR